jgi:PAS domain S-box-containing protein
MPVHKKQPKKNKLFWEEDHFRMIVENSTDLIAATDTKGDFLYVSPSHLPILGYKSEELIGVNSFTLIHPGDREKALKEFQKALQGIPTSLVEFRALDKKGRMVILEATVSSLVKYKNKQPIFVAVLRDITQRKKVEQSKSEFIDIASHELKTPLTSIKVLVQLLQKDLRTSKHEIKRKYVNLLDLQITNFDNLVQKLILCSEIQTGTLKLEKNTITLKNLINDTISLFPEVKKLLQINHILPDSLLVDEKNIKKALYFVLQNALEFSDNKPVNIKTTNDKDNITIIVEDFGKGMPITEHRRIFNKFYQSKVNTTEIKYGFGLGLYLANEIMKLHNGTLTVTHNSLGGSLFTFIFPTMKDE